MEAVNGTTTGTDLNMQAAIYAQKKGQEVEEQQMQSVMKDLDENTQKQVQMENAQVTGVGGNLNIQG